jgi:hypothetical protein
MTRQDVAPRPAQHLRALATQYPGLFQQVDRLRAQRGKELPRWPDWCFLPLAGVVAILTRGAPAPDVRPLGPQIGIVGALVTWRATQGIYQFDPTVLAAVWETPLEGELPTSLLYRLPEWCCYVPLDPPRAGLSGFFVHLEWDANTRQPELRFVLDAGQPGLEDLLPVALHIDRPTLVEAVHGTLETSAQNVLRHGEVEQATTIWQHAEQAAQGLARLLTPLVSLTLYLCSVTAEFRDPRGSGRQPARPQPTKTKQGLRLFPPAAPTAWEVSSRLGAALRRAAAQEAAAPATPSAAAEPADTAPRARPQAHIRRAHWHSFWTGARTDPGARRLVVRWLPPIPVGLGDDLVPTVHRVE